MFEFRCKGRTGTTFGSKKIDEFKQQVKAIQSFHRLFVEKTGNQWSDQGNFIKLANKHYPLEIDYGRESDNKQIDRGICSNTSSVLSQSLQELILLIFDVETMKKTLLSFEIDLAKMPLGKLSRNQLHAAFQVLTDLQRLINDDSTNRTAIIDATNRFYTLIPHDFGLSKPKILDRIDLIKSKTEMIDNLLEIEVAYSMLRGTNDEENEHPIDAHYKKLKCHLQPIDRNSEEFHDIEQYMMTNHASTHNQYALQLKHLFRVTREGENERFDKWLKFDNHQLLWHGSRITNFAGILSEGLRIAPAEAPMVNEQMKFSSSSAPIFLCSF